jgi:hypothetical protein
VSETTRLGIAITASDQGANASIAQLRSTLRGLQETLASVSSNALYSGTTVVSSLQAEIAAVNQQIAARSGQVTAIQAVTTAVREQTAAAEVLHRTLQQGVNITGGGVSSDRQILSAAASAKTLATSLSAAAAQDAFLREEAIATAAALAKQAEATALVAKINQDRAEATYANRDLDLINAQARAEANYENQSRDAAAIRLRQEAEYENAVRDAILAKARAEAEYENQGIDATSARARAEATYENQMRDAIAARERSEAEYENRRLDAIATRTRAEAEYENAQRTAAARAYTASAPGIIAAHGPQFAAPQAAATTIARGGTSAEAQAAASAAATEALRQQVVAIRAVAEAEAAAGAAGATEGEIAAAGARAATLAFENQARAAITAGRAAEGSAIPVRRVVSLLDEGMRNQRGAMFATLGAGLKDAGLGAAGLSASMGVLVALMSGAAIIHGAEAMGKWAQETRAAASAAGMGLADYSELQGALTMIGLKGGEADASLRHLAQSLSTAISDPASKSAEAFHNLGISQNELVATGGNLGALLPTLANAFTLTADGAQKTANMEEVAGRSFEHLIPAINKGAEGFKALQEAAKAAGITLSEEAAKKMEETGQQAETLSTKIKGQGVQAFEAWDDSIRVFIGIASAAVEAIGKIISAIGKMEQAKLDATKWIGTQIGNAWNWLNTTQGGAPTTGPLMSQGGPRATPQEPIGSKIGTQLFGPPASVLPLQEPVTEMEQRNLRMAQAGAAAGGSHIAQLQAEIGVLREYVNADKARVAQSATGNKQLVEDETALANKQRELASAEASGGKGAARQATQDWIAQEKLKIAEAQGDSAKIKAIYQEMLDGIVSSHKATAAQIANIQREMINAVTAAQVKETDAQAKQEEQANRMLVLNTKLQQMASGKYVYQGQEKAQGPSADIARSQGYLDEAAQVQQRSQTLISSYQAEAAAAEQGSTLQKDIQQKILDVTMQAKEQEIALYQKAGDAAVAAANKTAQAFQQFADGVGSALETASTGILNALIAPQQMQLKAGFTTIHYSEQGNELRAAMGKAIISIADDFEKSMEQGVSHMLASLLSGGTSNTLGDLFGKLMSKALGSLTGDAAGGALHMVAGAAGGATSQAVGNAGQTAGAASAAAITQPIVAATTTASAANVAVTTSTGAQQSAVVTSTAASQTAGSATSFISNAAQNTADIISQTGSIVGAILASAGQEILQLLGLQAKPSVLGTTYAYGGIVPSAAGGMMVGGTGGASLAILHAREMVLPEHLSRGIQGMINSGNANAHLNYSPTINTGSRGRGGTGMTRGEFHQMMAMHSGSMLGQARNMIRSGWRPS